MMAYKNLVALAAATYGDAFRHFRDFVCARNEIADYTASGIGWTLHDASYAVDESNISAGDWVVFYSTGESGAEKLYFRLKAYSATYFLLEGYQHWDSTTHTGVNRFGDTYYSLNVSTLYKVWVYGDLNSFSLLVDVDDAYSCGGTWGGLGDFPWPHEPHIVSSALTAGADVPIAIDDSSGIEFSTGQPLFIMDDVNIEVAAIKTNDNSTIMTADLVNSYSAGAIVRSHVPIAVDANLSYFLSSYTSYVKGLILADGTINASFSGQIGSVAYAANNDPSTSLNAYVAGKHAICTTTGPGLTVVFPNIIYLSGIGSLSVNDMLIDQNGNNWRLLKLNTTYFAFLEV